MANTPGGGAVIVGVSNDGQLIGTDLEAEWLRHRMWELSGKALTVDIATHEIAGRRSRGSSLAGVGLRWGVFGLTSRSLGSQWPSRVITPSDWKHSHVTGRLVICDLRLRSGA